MIDEHNAAAFIEGCETFVLFGDLSDDEENYEILNKAREYAAARIRRLIRSTGVNQ